LTGPTLTARGLTKAFRGRTVVEDVSLEVAPGEIVGLFGPNGAGTSENPSTECPSIFAPGGGSATCPRRPRFFGG